MKLMIMTGHMMPLQNIFARETKSLALITGGVGGQVASQTVQSLAATNEVCTMPGRLPLLLPQRAGYRRHFSEN